MCKCPMLTIFSRKWYEVSYPLCTKCAMLIAKISHAWFDVFCILLFWLLSITSSLDLYFILFLELMVQLSLLQKWSSTTQVLRWLYKNRCRKQNSGIFVNNFKFLKTIVSNPSLKRNYDIGSCRTDIECEL